MEHAVLLHEASDLKILKSILQNKSKVTNDGLHGVEGHLERNYGVKFITSSNQGVDYQYDQDTSM